MTSFGKEKLNTLPIVDDEGRLLYMVFRKDYATHKEYPLELLDNKNVISLVLVSTPAIMLNVFLLWLTQALTYCALTPPKVTVHGKKLLWTGSVNITVTA